MKFGAPYRSRTCGLKIRSLALYPAELRARAEIANNHFTPACKAGYGDIMDEPVIKPANAAAIAGRHFRSFDFMMAAFVAILLLSNVIGAAKLAQIDFPTFFTLRWNSWSFPVFGTRSFGAGIMFFPLGYLLGDILTEVYGYARARRCIWAGFAALLFMAFMSWVVVALPPAAGWGNQAAYEAVFGQVPRIVFASITAFWVGEFVNSFVMARMKIWTRGDKLWTRTIGSTVCGQFVDSIIFYPLAFWNAQGWTHEGVITVMFTNWALKVLWEVLLTPVTYAIVNFLKRHEGVDVFDEGTDFSPFRTRV